MSAVGIRIKLDTRDFDAAFGKVLKALPANIRSAVNSTARIARRAAVKELARDANVPAARLRASLPLISAARSGGPIYTATWTPKKGANVIRSAGGLAPAFTRGTPIEVSTFATTGGGSRALALPRGFVILGRGGNRLVVARTGKGRDAFRVIYAENAKTAMSQPDNVVRKAWQRTAEDAYPIALASGVSAALQGSDNAAPLGSVSVRGVSLSGGDD